jgi:hypothetical protein
MSKDFGRRDFLKMGGVSLSTLLSSLAFSRLKRWQTPEPPVGPFSPPFPREMERDQGELARVTISEIDLRSEPRDDAPIIGKRYRDQLVHIYEEVIPPDAPAFYNRLWYRVWGGYLHSAHLQKVQVRLNLALTSVPESGQLCEVTVPYTTAYIKDRWEGWQPWRGSRLYYTSTHWATGLETGPDGKAWYQITNELSSSEVYIVPASHLRPVLPKEYAPISTDVPPHEKHIEVSISEQRLRAFEYDQVVFSTRISSGIPSRTPPGELPTATPTGRFRIYSKMPSKHMGSVAGGPEVEDNNGFSLPGVPWTCFFKSPGGYAFHGTYWHNNFGLQMSHGCVNMRNEDSLWLFRWTTPEFHATIESHADWERRGNGTLVLIS